MLTGLATRNAKINARANLIGSIAELLRGDHMEHGYHRVILPLTNTRRLDNVLEPTRAAVRVKHEEVPGRSDNLAPQLTRATGESLYNTSKRGCVEVASDLQSVAINLRAYVDVFSDNLRELFTDYIGFLERVDWFEKLCLFFQVLQRFETADLSPATASENRLRGEAAGGREHT